MRLSLQIGNKEYGKTEGSVEVEADQSKRPEETLHREVRDVVEKMEGKKSTRRSVQSG